MLVPINPCFGMRLTTAAEDRRVAEIETQCLHCEINEIVQRHLERDDPINLPELVAKVGESLVELILVAPEDQWGILLAEALRSIGEAYLEKSGAYGAETAH
jgi:hypothetical protein